MVDSRLPPSSFVFTGIVHTQTGFGELRFSVIVPNLDMKVFIMTFPSCLEILVQALKLPGALGNSSY
jgi:hypothetical protein